jgi:predicted metal-dependent HD superfamily phosphohydrolase
VDLAARFADAVTEVGGSPQATIISDVLRRWAEPHRSYHNLDHLGVVLDVADAWPDYADNVDLVRLALFFHDAVYDPRAADNEERSAVLAASLLDRCSVPAAARDEVHRLVRLTAGHTVDPADRNGSLMADADLAVLAWDWPSYRAYSQAIRAEYAPTRASKATPAFSRVMSSCTTSPCQRSRSRSRSSTGFASRNADVTAQDAEVAVG